MIDFILVLLKIFEEFDCLLSVINKFSKQITLISEEFIYITKQ